MIVLYINAHIAFFDMIDIFLANELVIHFEAGSMLKSLVKFLNRYCMMMHWLNMFMMGSMRLKMFDDNWVRWADFEAFRLDALAEEERQCLLVTDFDMSVHLDAFTTPKVIQVALAEPLLCCFSVELVLCVEGDALVVPNIGLKLVVASHSMTEQAIFVTRKFLLVINELVLEFFILLLEMMLLSSLSLMLSLFCLTHLFSNMAAFIVGLSVALQWCLVLLKVVLWVVLMMLVMAVAMVDLFIFNLVDIDTRLMSQSIVNWRMGLLDQVRITQVSLDSLNVMDAIKMIIVMVLMSVLVLISSHILLDSSGSSSCLSLMRFLTVLHLSVLH